MSHIRQVYQNINELKNLLQQLRDMVLRQRTDVVALDVASVNAQRMAIERLYQQVDAAGAVVKSSIAAAGRIAGISADDLTGLMAAIPKPDRESFSALQAEVRSLAEEVEQALAVNRMLLQDSLAFIEQSMTLFTGMLKNSSTYGQGGRFVDSVTRSSIINREI